MGLGRAHNKHGCDGQLQQPRTMVAANAPRSLRSGVSTEIYNGRYMQTVLGDFGHWATYLR